MRRSVLGSVIAFAAVVGSADASGQIVRGVVRQAGTSAPVAGAVISIVDSAGRALARTVSNEHGTYSIAWVSAAPRLRIVRIGLRQVSISLPAGSPHDVSIDIAMEPVPALLDTVRVATNAVCGASADRQTAARLWEQARAGLLNAIVARDASPAQVSILTFERRMDRRDQRVTQQRSHLIAGSSRRPIQAARAAKAFVEQGFRSLRGADELFYAPDADVMFDESFASTHCFSIQRADDVHKGQIGLSFEPTPDRLGDTLVDVRGVLWLDPAAARLVQLDFRFTGINAAAERAGAGGMIHFQSIANGVVFIDEWTMVIPAVSVLKNTASLIDITESGGSVLTAKWPDGTGWSARTSAISGHIADRSAADAPVRGVILAFDGLLDSTGTDAMGAFGFSPMIPGRYSLHAVDTTLGRFLKRRVVDRDVVVTRGDTTRIDLDMRSFGSMVADLCRGDRPTPRTTTIIGSVGDGGADWPKRLSITVVGAKEIGVDDSGNFKACGVPSDRPVGLGLRAGRILIADTTIILNRDSTVRIVEWKLRSGLFDEVERGDGASVAGTVVDAVDGRPIRDADVWAVFSDAHARTDSAGRFHIYGLKNGPQFVQVRRIGFAAQRDTITLQRGEEGVRAFKLARQVTELDTVRSTTGAVKYISPRLQAFESRRAQGIGRFVSEAELRKNDNGSLSSILGTRVPGTHLVAYGGSMFLASSRSGTQVLADPSDRKSPRGCWVAVYIDGVQIYNGASAAADPSTLQSISPPAPDMARMPVSDFGGVEYYASGTIPPQFNGRKETSCGALLLWTRER